MYALERPYQTDQQGRVVIHYRINATLPPQVPFSADQFVQAVQKSARPWMDAAPDKVFLVYDGTTTDLPEGYHNVVGFAPSDTSHVARTPLGTYATGFDLVLSSKDAWDYRPCAPPSTPCDSYASDAGYFDMGNILTHEWGHVLGLVHVDDPQGSELTMNPAEAGGQVGTCTRNKVTLGLGDVLGVRKLYPTSAPMPTLYTP